MRGIPPMWTIVSFATAAPLCVLLKTGDIIIRRGPWQERDKGQTFVLEGLIMREDVNRKRVVPVAESELF